MSLIIYLLANMISFAGETVLVDETFTTILSADKVNFDAAFHCEPGFAGWYPTGDLITMGTWGMNLGFEVENHVTALSREGLAADPPPGMGAGKRPYRQGCQPLMDRLREKMTNNNQIEVVVKRSVVLGKTSSTRTRFDEASQQFIDEQVTADVITQWVTLEIEGLRFTSFTKMNGKILSKK